MKSFVYWKETVSTHLCNICAHYYLNERIWDKYTRVCLCLMLLYINLRSRIYIVFKLEIWQQYSVFLLLCELNIEWTRYSLRTAECVLRIFLYRSIVRRCLCIHWHWHLLHAHRLNGIRNNNIIFTSHPAPLPISHCRTFADRMRDFSQRDKNSE